MSAKRIFQKVYGKDVNFITPSLIRYGRRGDYVYELSKGGGLMPNTALFGVTVVNAVTMDIELDMSDCYQTLGDALKHINQLGKGKDDE